MKTISRGSLASTLGYVDDQGNPSGRAIAQLMRDAIERWGLCPRRALFKHVRDQLRASNVSTDAVPSVLERLIAFGECEQVTVGHDIYVAPAERRWMATGNGLATLLGIAVPPNGTPRFSTNDPFDLALRVHVENDDQVAALAAHGAREIALEEWLQPLGYLHHLARREGGVVRSDEYGLSSFWQRLESILTESGLMLGADAQVRAVIGAPGGFFGRYSANTPEGRWSEELPDGIWCAYRKGHGDGHWLPTLVSVDGDERRALDLFDDDEWRWALLARSRAIGPTELHRDLGDELQVTWPLPGQLWAALDIIGIPTGRWRWRISATAADLWTSLR